MIYICLLKAIPVSLLLYKIFLWAYKTGIRAVSPWNRKARLWINGRKDLVGKISLLAGAGTGPRIWMHCASLGEFEQGKPVLEMIRRQYRDAFIVLTFFSPSGYEVVKDHAIADQVLYLPADSQKNARLFINACHPDLVLWVKYEFWYYYLTELKAGNIPVLLISGVFRSQQAFFKWYGNLQRKMLECFAHVFVQTEVSKKLLEQIGFGEKTSVGGDTRFDRVIAISEKAASLPMIEAFTGTHTVIVAGSTWEEDEEELDHYANTHPRIRFIIAPHEIDEEHLTSIEKLFRRCIRYSSWEKNYDLRNGAYSSKTEPPNVLLIDNIGMLSRLYRYATIAYLGGGFGDDGVHNVLEAAVYGKPVVYGPAIDKYIEAIELAESGGGIVIDSALEAEAVFSRLLSNGDEYRQCCEAAQKYVYSKKGATEKIGRYIQEKRLLTS
jgi:3-deoxy-D-manno-octulosonic-acid transferase